MGVIAAGLRGLRQDYTEGREGCNFECSAMHLGTLIKNLYELNFLCYPPETPFGQFSLAEVVQGITAMKTPKWYAESAQYSRRSYQSAHQCPRRSQQVGLEAVEFGFGEKRPDVNMDTLNEFAALLVYGIKEKMEGLQLDDFNSPI